MLNVPSFNLERHLTQKIQPYFRSKMDQYTGQLCCFLQDAGGIFIHADTLVTFMYVRMYSENGNDSVVDRVLLELVMNGLPVTSVDTEAHWNEYVVGWPAVKRTMQTFVSVAWLAEVPRNWMKNRLSLMIFWLFQQWLPMVGLLWSK